MFSMRANVSDVKFNSAVTTEEVATGRGGHSAHAGRRRHVARGGVGAGLSAPRGGAAHAAGVREAEGEPATVFSQSASQGDDRSRR